MAEKQTRLKPLVSVERADGKGGIKVTLSQSASTDVDVMRHLAHRVVDLMADHGLKAHLAYDAGNGLTLLCYTIIRNYVMEMVREATASAKTSAKKPAKGDPK